MNILEVKHLGRQENGNYVVKDISFTQQPLEKIAIAGATGSGKSSLLKMIAGLLTPTSGQVIFQKERVLGPEEKLIPGHPAIAYLSQHFELRNHYRVGEFLDMANKVTEAEARHIYSVCRIGHLLRRWTHQLSGGEKQRIALARLLVTTPRLLLLDEPYSNLDPFHKSILKKVIDDLSNVLGITCILVSHDPLDTLSWADRILVLEKGELAQSDTPYNVYKRPTNEYTAALFGKYNQLSPAILDTLSAGEDSLRPHSPFLRPEDLQLSAIGKGLKGEVTKVGFMGSFYEVEITIEDTTIILHTAINPPAPADEVYVSLKKR